MVPLIRSHIKKKKCRVKRVSLIYFLLFFFHSLFASFLFSFSKNEVDGLCIVHIFFCFVLLGENYTVYAITSIVWKEKCENSTPKMRVSTGIEEE